MPIGKDSITKRVAKQAEPTTEAPVKEEKIAPELVAPTAAAPEKKAPAKKTTSTATGEKKTATAAKKPASTAKKPAAPKAEAAPAVKEEPKAEAPKVDTAVLANVSPETVAAVLGHKEDEQYEKVQIGKKMPSFLL